MHIHMFKLHKLHHQLSELKKKQIKKKHLTSQSELQIYAIKQKKNVQEQNTVSIDYKILNSENCTRKNWLAHQKSS